MSKRFIGFLIGTVLLFIGSVVVAENKKIDEPILIPLGLQTINIGTERDYFTLSYITNRNEAVRVAMVYVGDDVLDVYNSSSDFFTDQSSNSFTIVKSFTYYELHEQQVELNNSQFERVRNYLQQGEMVKVVFSNGTMLDYSLALNFYNYEDHSLLEDENPIEPDGNFSETQFTFKEAVIIEDIQTTFSTPFIQLYKGEQKLSLPYVAQPQEKLTLHISPNERFGFSIIYFASINGTKLTGEPFSQQLSVKAKDVPSEEWIQRYVQVVGEH
jgi:hypothetical protein